MATGNNVYNYGQTPIAQKQPTGQQSPLSAQNPQPPMMQGAPSAENASVGTPTWGQPAQSQTTPGGLNGSFGNSTPSAPPSGVDYGQTRGGANSSANWGAPGGGAAAIVGARPDIGVNQDYIDTAYDSAMRQMQPQIEARQAQLSQQLVNKGLQPGTAAYNAEMDRMNRMENDMLQSAAYGAQQTGLAAQNQEYQQQLGYDQLANALQQAQIGAAAQRGSAAASANASMYNAQLANQLGYSQLGEQGRQFDINDIYRTQGQDQQFMLGMGNLYNQFANTGLNQWQAQNAANNQWYQQAGQMANNAPGVMFTPQTDYTGNQIGANQNAVQAGQAQNQMYADMIGAGLGAIPFSDKRLKENIEHVDTVDGINVYEFDYINKDIGAGRYRGVIAQEIEADYPDAIVTDINGYMRVDYSQLPVDMELVSEVSV